METGKSELRLQNQNADNGKISLHRESKSNDSSISSPDLSMETSGILPESLAEQLVEEALSWASLHGFVVGDRFDEKSGRFPGVGLVHAPFTLLPTPFPEERYKRALELAPLFNELVDRVSLDGKFLQEALSRTKRGDYFTARLLDIHSLVLQGGVKQNINLGLNRSDYMLDMPTGALLQVELNTISSSFAGLGTLISQLHRFLIHSMRKQHGLEATKVPENRALDGFVEAMALGFKEFGDSSAVVLMIVQPEERNMYDQYWLSFKLYDAYGIKMIQRTLAEVDLQAKVLQDGTLLIGQETIAIVYYRAGYGPRDYPSEVEWHARILMELSNAIKCPTISYHLAGTKKIQQELAKPGVLERFVQDEESAWKLRSCFAGLWGLDSDDCLAIVNEAITKPEAFVLKPQREGGGNNLYGKDLMEKLKELRDKSDKEGLAAYILMQKICAAVHTSYLIRRGNFSAEQAVSELGIFSTYLRNGDNVIMNKPTGYLLRTKPSYINEGGVAAGFATLDSLYLV